MVSEHGNRWELRVFFLMQYMRVCLKWGYPPINGWFMIEHPMKMDDWGSPYFRKPLWLIKG